MEGTCISKHGEYRSANEQIGWPQTNRDYNTTGQEAGTTPYIKEIKAMKQSLSHWNLRKYATISTDHTFYQFRTSTTARREHSHHSPRATIHAETMAHES
jgi:hypothetical protein